MGPEERRALVIRIARKGEFGVVPESATGKMSLLFQYEDCKSAWPLNSPDELAADGSVDSMIAPRYERVLCFKADQERNTIEANSIPFGAYHADSWQMCTP